jgi:GTP-binding protein LepA
MKFSNPAAPLRALIFDSIFDGYRGSIVYIRVFDGTVREKDKIKFFVSDKVFDAEEIGVLEMQRVRTKELSAGDVGYLIPGARDVHDTKVGDTVTNVVNPAAGPLPRECGQFLGAP